MARIRLYYLLTIKIQDCSKSRCNRYNYSCTCKPPSPLPKKGKEKGTSTSRSVKSLSLLRAPNGSQFWDTVSTATILVLGNRNTCVNQLNSRDRDMSWLRDEISGHLSLFNHLQLYSIQLLPFYKRDAEKLYHCCKFCWVWTCGWKSEICVKRYFHILSVWNSH